MSDGPVHVRLLGPVVVEGEAGPEPTTSPLVRTLLALLASRPGQVVSTDRLIDQLWSEASPENPRKALQVQISRLRGWLLQGGVDRSALRHGHGGYVLAIAPEHVDLVRFARSAQATVRADGATEVVRQAEAALAEWRGEPFGGCVDCPDLAVERAHHRELHLVTIERRAEALLELARPEDAVVALTGPRRQNMVQERLTELLMVALFRLGRQQEALAAYGETRRFLVDEFGIGPGDALVRAEAAVLGQDPVLLGAPPPPTPPALPDRPTIVGRRAELATVAERLVAPDRGALVVVTGEAGAGKTTLVGAAANDAAEAGAVVGIGAFDDDAPLAGWRDALTAIGVDPEALADEQRTLAVWAALGNAARTTPVLAVLEDAHVADTTSLRLLQGLVRRGLPAGVVVLVTARSPDTEPHDGWATTAADVARSPGTAMLPIGALSRADADDLVGTRLAHLPADAVATVAAELWERSAGLPLHLVSLLDLMEGAETVEDCLTVAREVPGSLQPLLDHQLRSLPAASREVVEALAVTGPVPVDAAAALVDLTPLAALRALRPAQERGVVVDVGGLLQLRHALWGTAVEAAMGRAVAEELHLRRLAQLVAGDGDPFEVLRHALGAGRRLDATTRATHRAAAGRAAFARGAYAEAADHLAEAVSDAGDDDALAIGLRIDQGLALGACGRSAEADEVLDTVVFRSAATVDQVVAAAVGHELLGFRVVGDARRLARLEEALRSSKDVDAPTRIEVIRALLIEESLVPDRPRSDAAADELDALVAAVGDDLDPALTARLAAMRARAVVEAPVLAEVRLDLARRAHDAALDAGQPGLVLDALELLVSATLAAGRPGDEVEDVRWVLGQTAELANRPRSRWAASLLPAATALAEGADDRADALAEAALGRGFEMGIPDAAGAYGVHLVTSRYLRGRLGEADVVALIDGVTDQYPSIPAWPAAGALARAQGGDGPAARAHLRLFLDRRAEQVGHYFDRPALGMAALAAYIAGDHPVCREAAQVVVEGLPVDEDAVIVVGVGAAAMGPVELYRALALAVLGDGPDALHRAGVARSIAARLQWAPWVEGAEALIAAVTAPASGRTPPPVPGPTPISSPLGLRRLP